MRRLGAVLTKLGRLVAPPHPTGLVLPGYGTEKQRSHRPFRVGGGNPSMQHFTEKEERPPPEELLVWRRLDQTRGEARLWSDVNTTQFLQDRVGPSEPQPRTGG
jgi:hypothetical protein